MIVGILEMNDNHETNFDQPSFYCNSETVIYCMVIAVIVAESLQTETLLDVSDVLHYRVKLQSFLKHLKAWMTSHFQLLNSDEREVIV